MRWPWTVTMILAVAVRYSYSVDRIFILNGRWLLGYCHVTDGAGTNPRAAASKWMVLC
jgi:hypothetical protein